ncbi:uncharacterized protein LOC124260020 [Haliotis rubra]|uniref:uncharacterized protein LOC124260020 n=1 Tax=Haliotis rubra TaxID=36100 RepID=UPI001EE5FD14|nr:uncharacterized protein LOC124260020 [Haliotis rubra]
MKAVALLLLFVVFATLPSETSGWGWFKRVVRKVKDGVRKVVNKIKDFGNRIRHGRAVHADMTDEEMVEALATRDINELFEVEQLSDADKAELNNIQREARDLMDQLDALDD